MKNNQKEFVHFIKQSPTAFHAVNSVKAILENNGFLELKKLSDLVFRDPKKADAEIDEKKGYFFTRNESSLIAVRFPQKNPKGFHIMASHSDSPCFKLKTEPEITVENRYVKLNVEKYGGMILSSWLDRPLGIAGRVITKNQETGHFISHLTNLKQCAVIPNVAIHFNRELNNGFVYNPQVDMLPLFGSNLKKTVKESIADQLHILPEEILGEDLYLYVDQEPVFIGMEGEYILSPRLDDLECAFASLQGFVESKQEEYIAVYCLFDNEEIGSRTRQGADSDFIKQILTEVWKYADKMRAEKITEKAQPADSIDFTEALQNSFLLSADNAHALHPNHPEKSDVTNKPFLNGGIVLKFNGNSHYTTDGFSQAFVTDLCRKAEIPLQTFANRSDIQGGSTLGNIMMSHASIPAADIGLGQFAMHSSVETAGVKDIEYLIKLSKIFYTS